MYAYMWISVLQHRDEGSCRSARVLIPARDRWPCAAWKESIAHSDAPTRKKKEEIGKDREREKEERKKERSINMIM